MMHERMTERARRVMHLAEGEAERLGSVCVSPEHVLLAMVEGDGGVAVIALEGLGIDLRQLHAAIKRNIIPADADAERVQNVVGFAVDEARALDHRYVDTEDLLLGLIREGGPACGALSEQGVDLTKARAAVQKVLGFPDDLRAGEG